MYVINLFMLALPVIVTLIFFSICKGDSVSFVISENVHELGRIN